MSSNQDPVAARLPRFMLCGDASSWSAVLEEPTRVRDLVGSDLFAAFLKCFYGVDRVMALEQMLHLNQEHLDHSSNGYRRNGRVIGLLLASEMYELGAALQQLCEARVVERMRDASKWTPINELRGRWHKNALFKEIRNQLGYHLGEPDLYRRGLDRALGNSADVVFACGNGERRHDGELRERRTRNCLDN
jgi:hypothetical protein